MSDFLLELRSEEIPARMQAGARADLERLFRKAMDDAGVALTEVTVWSTPRRLALIARGLPTATAAVSEEVKGPRVGAPPQALEGFLRKTGLAESDLVERDGVLFAVIEKPGRATADVLAEAIDQIGKPIVVVEMIVKKAKDRVEKRGIIFLDSEDDFKDAKNLGIAHHTLSIKQSCKHLLDELAVDRLGRAGVDLDEVDGIHGCCQRVLVR